MGIFDTYLIKPTLQQDILRIGLIGPKENHLIIHLKNFSIHSTFLIDCLLKSWRLTVFPHTSIILPWSLIPFSEYLQKRRPVWKESVSSFFRLIYANFCCHYGSWDNDCSVWIYDVVYSLYIKAACRGRRSRTGLWKKQAFMHDFP